jgi:hypothetical protein
MHQLLQLLQTGAQHPSTLGPLFWYTGLHLTWEQTLVVILMIQVQILEMTVHLGTTIVKVVEKLMFLLEGVSGSTVTRKL